MANTQGVIREMQIKTTVKYYYIPTRMAKMNGQCLTYKGQEGCEETGKRIHSRKCEMA